MNRQDKPKITREKTAIMTSSKAAHDRNTPEWQLLHPEADDEDTRRLNIRDWLYSVGTPMVRTEYSTSVGPADIYLPNRRVMIEVKQKGKAVPDNTNYGSRRGETPLEQVARYISVEKPNEIRGLDANEDDVNLPWLGVVTDSEVWHIFELTDTGLVPLIEWKGRRLDSVSVHALKKLLVDRKVGKEWAPDNPTEIFREVLGVLSDTYETEKDVRDVVTQRELWYRQLRISGNQPDESHKDELFVLHTLLIAISTKISEMYGNTDIRYGFASWVKKTKWLSYVDGVIRQYNWKQTTGDTLRAIYMGLVDKKDRHIYGEYYTPDWLAEKICLEVIDDAYIERWVRTGNSEDERRRLGGVMDPTCGSGTFLYHAVRRIAGSKPVRDATMTNRDLTDMITSMVYGIDIHPVAVAMAKANVLRALPDKPGRPLHIYQGDSLQITRNADDDNQQKINELENHVFSIRSRKGVEIRFPLEFIQSEDFDSKMHRFVQAAVAGKKLPARVDDGIDDGRKPILKKAFDTLKEVCKEEGNDVWAWYVINQAGVYLLQQRASRIVANPPWVRMSSIQDVTRKDETIRLAKKLNLWTGGKNATGFNIASLFVIQCREMYGVRKDIKAGWVLPDAAMRGGGNWSEYIAQTEPSVVYDLGSLAFPEHSKACVNIFGTARKKPLRLELRSEERVPDQSETWDVVRKKTEFVPIKQYKIKKSEWYKGTRPMARQGANIGPSCLVILNDDYTKNANTIAATTRRSIHGVWKGMTFPVEVPRRYVRECLFSKEGLFPYVIGRPRMVILPIDNKGCFLDARNNIRWWRDACDKYAANKGLGDTTATTLEAHINHNQKLGKQFPLSKNMVVYNRAGSNLYAARLDPPMIIDSELCRVPTNSKNEALFLTAILNADCLAERFRQTRKSDRHFQTYFWGEVPIPRYDSKSKDHVRLAKLALCAEHVASHIPTPTYVGIKQSLTDDGVSQDIDVVVSRIMKKAYGTRATNH